MRFDVPIASGPEGSSDGAESRPASPAGVSLDELTPRLIVQALDRHIVGQAAAKRVVAIALRNRIRRRRLEPAIREEVSPKNIIMIGPTGVGKTEIARRLAKLVDAPLVKVEATKYTEVGYVGRDVESMIRDLAETAMKMVRRREEERSRAEAERRARDRILDTLAERGRGAGTGRRILAGFGSAAATHVETEPVSGSREELAARYDEGSLDDSRIEVEIREKSPLSNLLEVPGLDENMLGSMREMMERSMPPRSRRTSMTVRQARAVLVDQALEELIDEEKLQREAVELAEESGIVFIDEIDKIAARGGGSGPDVSRQGVQRDLLPIVEGSAVKTKYGFVRTNHVLFIAAGAFTDSKPSDLMAELQGRFPLRVELESLDAADFQRILTEPDHSLVEQYVELMRTDGVRLDFRPDAIEEMARAAAETNRRTEDIGARRLHTILERVLQDVSFDAPDTVSGEVVVDREYVGARLNGLVADEDLSRFIL